MAGPNVSGTPLNSEPTVWSSRVLYYLDKTYVYVSALTNRDYEGEAKAGGTVKVFRVNNVSVSDHTGPWTDNDWQALGDTAYELQIDQEKRFIFKLSRVREQFSAIRMLDQGSQRAAQAIGDVIDQFVASRYTQVNAANYYGDDVTPITVGLGSGETRPTAALAKLKEKLVAAKAPAQGARVVVPEWFGTALELELSGRATALGDAATRGEVANKPGFMGSIMGFDIFVSPNVPNTAGAKYKVLAGQPLITFASAIEEINTVDLQNDFATGVKGLFVYGAKLFDGNAMALGTFNRGTY